MHWLRAVITATWIRRLGTLLMPNDSTGLWTAIGATAATVLAILAIRISRRLLFIEDTPVLLIQREQGQTIARNVGRGAALNVFACDSDGKIVSKIPSIAPNMDAVLKGARLSFQTALRVYCSSITGTWFVSKALGQSILGDDPSFPVHTTFKRTQGRRIPRPVKMALRKQAQSADEYLDALGSLFSTQGWAFRTKGRWKRFRLWRDRCYYGLGEERRLRVYRNRIGRLATAPPTDRDGWPIDLNRETRCWHTTILRVAHTASTIDEDGTLVCQIELSNLHGEKAAGLVIVNRRVWTILKELPRNETSPMRGCMRHDPRPSWMAAL